MLKHIRTKRTKDKNPPILTEKITTPIKNSNLGLYRKSKIIQIPDDLKSNNFPEKLKLEKFNISEANCKSLNRYNPEQLFKTANNTFLPSSPENNDDIKQKKFALGQEILQNMGYKEIFRIENELSVQETTKKNHVVFKF